MSQPFVVVDRRRRKIVAGFASREEAEAFRDGLVVSSAGAEDVLSIRSRLGGGLERGSRADRPATMKRPRLSRDRRRGSRRAR